MPLRPATIGDIPVLLHHRRRMFFDMGYTDPAHLDLMETSSRTYLEHAIPAARYFGVLVEDEGAVVAGGGVLLADWPGSLVHAGNVRPWILNMYVEPEHRRKGHARCVLAALVDWCRAQGFSYVALHASEAGRHLYEKFGFTDSNEMRLKL